MVNRACRIVVSEGFGGPGDRIIITAGVPLGTPGSTNMLRIAYIGSDGVTGTDPDHGKMIWQRPCALPSARPLPL